MTVAARLHTPDPDADAAVEWMADGACRGGDVGRFVFDERNDARSGLRRTSEARAICAACPVEHACREYAIEHRHVGIWGGTTTTERRRIRLARTRTDGVRL